MNQITTKPFRSQINSEDNLPDEMVEIINKYNIRLGSGPLPEEKLALVQALIYLEQSPTASWMLNEIASHNVFISLGNHRVSSVDVHDNIIFWNPKQSITVFDPLTGRPDGVQSAAIILLHEIGHIVVPGAYDLRWDAQFDDVGERNLSVVINKAARELGEIERFDHKAASLPTTDNPTKHTNNADDWVQQNWFGQDEIGPKYNDNAPSSSPSFGGSGEFIDWILNCLWEIFPVAHNGGVESAIWQDDKCSFDWFSASLPMENLPSIVQTNEVILVGVVQDQQV